MRLIAAIQNGVFYRCRIGIETGATPQRTRAVLRFISRAVPVGTECRMLTLARAL